MDKKDELITKLEDYIDWAGWKNQSPISIAYIHGWRIEEEDFHEEITKRGEISKLKEEIYGK